MSSPDGYLPLVVVTRGGHAESLHHGAVAVARPGGQLVASFGDQSLTTFLRSSAKPWQALPFLESGAADALGVDDEELALVCASHGGTPAHVAVVERLQRKAGIEPSLLACGTHMPYDPAAATQLRQAGQSPQPNHHNCSGKHSAMLATAAYLQEPLEGYLAPEHPVQVRILKAVSEITGLTSEAIGTGTDGCSAPNFSLPLVDAATAYARLADPSGMVEGRRRALERIWAAMTGHPVLVSGEGRLDALLMGAQPGRVLTKAGAEGYLGMALRGGAGEPSLGVALKIADGDGAGRALPVAAVAVLQALGWLRPDDASAILDLAVEPITSHAGRVVGAVQPLLELAWTGD
jgi:L-asparaginase II